MFSPSTANSESTAAAFTVPIGAGPLGASPGYFGRSAIRSGIPRISAMNRILFDSIGPSGCPAAAGFHQIFATIALRSGSAIVWSYSSRVISSVFAHLKPSTWSFAMPRFSA